MQTTGFRTRLLKRIDILVAIRSGPEEKKIRIYRLIMFHRTTLFRLKWFSVVQKRTMVLPVSSIATIFINTSRARIQYTGICLPVSGIIIGHSHDIHNALLYVRLLRHWNPAFWFSTV